MGRGVKNYYQAMNQIYGRLQDEESRVLFEMRINYLINQDCNDYMEGLHGLYNDWYSQKELNRKLSMNPKGIIIFGVGPCGMTLKQRLQYFIGDLNILLCDTYRAGEIVDGKRVLSINEVVQEYREYLVVIGTDRYGDEVYNELVQNGFDEANILSAEYSMTLGTRGKQYFDVFQPHEDEIFIDAGCFNGYTSLDFLEWADGNCKKIYALEPLNDAYTAIKEMKIPKTEVLNYAAWNDWEKLRFVERGTGSSVGSGGNVEVQGIDIDSLMRKGEDKVTFIKMDIEGSELKALEGAENVIIKHHPRLAISIYHKPEDVIEIPLYILQLVPDYKLYIRHYCSSMCETILYAEI